MMLLQINSWLQNYYFWFQFHEVDLSHVYLAYTADDAVRPKTSKSSKSGRPKTANRPKSSRK